MKILVIGCNGMAGHIISLYLKEKGHDVTGYAREKSRFVNTVVGDATDFEFLKKIIINGKYDSVINCVGLLNQFAENNHPMAVIVNSYLPEHGLCIFRDKGFIYRRRFSRWNIVL